MKEDPAATVDSSATQDASPRSKSAAIARATDATLDGSSGGGSPGILDAASPRRPTERVRYFGDYELIEEIARGGMGVVYKARQVSLNRTVALKMILAGRLASVAEEQRFRAEAEAAANLDNPNIVPLYEVGEYEGRQYFTMKLMDGGSLGQSISRNGKAYTQNPRSAAKLMAIVAGAVHYGHQRGILHRDLKPANVLLDSAGAPYVTDFGLAKRMDRPGEGDRGRRATQVEVTVSGTVVGTPAYMAPEQALGRVRQVTVATDVYGVGAILYHLLTGCPPFDGANLMDVLRDVAEREPVRPRSLNPKIDRDLETICLKALAKEPTGRYASAEAMREDLERWLAGEPILARRTGLMERGVKWARRRPAIAALLGAILLTLLSGMVLVTWQWQRAEQQRRVAERERGIAVQQQAIAEVQRQRADDESRRQKRTAASLALDRGIKTCDQGDVSRGLLWMAHGLEMAGPENPDLQWDARMNIASWFPHLHRLNYQLQIIRGRARQLAYSADGTRLVAASDSGDVDVLAPEARLTDISVWDTATGSPIGIPFASGYGAPETMIAPDGSCVYFARGGRLVVWDVRSQTFSQHSLEGLDKVQAMAMSPDGARLAAACSGSTLRVWDLATGKRIGRDMGGTKPANPLKVFHNPSYTPPDGRSILALALNGDGSRLLAGYADGDAILWDISAAKPVGEPLHHIKAVQAVAFRPDGTAFITAGKDYRIRIWDARTLAPGPVIRHVSDITAVAYSHDGKRLISASHDYTVRVWDADTGKLIGTPLLQNGWVQAVAFHPDSTAFASSDGSGVRTWRLAEMPAPRFLPHRGGGSAVAYSADGQHLATGGFDKTVRVWDPRTGEPQGPPLQLDQPSLLLAFTPDGRTLITGDRDAQITYWDWATGTPQRSVRLDGCARPLRLALSPDFTRITAAHRNYVVHIWDLATGKPIGSAVPFYTWQLGAAWSPDGSKLAIGSWANFRVELFDAATMRSVGQHPHLGGAVSGLAFSPDSQRILAGWWGNKLAQVWDVKTGDPIGPSLEQSAGVTIAAYGPDGKTVAIGAGDGKVRLWDPATGMTLGPALQHPFRIHAISYAPDAAHIAAASSEYLDGGGQDDGVRIWSLPIALDGDAAAVRRHVESRTGLRLDKDTVRILNFAEWEQNRQAVNRPKVGP